MDSMREGLYPEGSITRRVNRENVLILGGGRALLMQLAHPMVAAGVDEHSDFRQRPMYRLRRTIRLTMAIVFGDRETALAAARAVNQTHGRVRGERYRALDPDLLLWVHATLVDSALATYETFVKPLPAREREDFYQESKVLGTLLGIPEDHFPAGLRQFEDYVAGIVLVTLGAAACFLLNAISFIAVIISLNMMRLPEFVKPTGRIAVWEGFRFIARTPPVLRVWPLPGRNVSLARDLSLSA